MDELIIELNASQAFSEKLDSLRSGGMTRADVIRQAVVLLSYATEQEKDGRQLGFVVKDDEGRNVVDEILQVSP
jgi:metal-responsive CopG/Arc/MetJ family transcriptional regulator